MPQAGEADVDLTVSSFPDNAAGLEFTGAGEKRHKWMIDDFILFYFNSKF